MWNSNSPNNSEFTTEQRFPTASLGNRWRTKRVFVVGAEAKHFEILSRYFQRSSRLQLAGWVTSLTFKIEEIAHNNPDIILIVCNKFDRSFFKTSWAFKQILPEVPVMVMGDAPVDIVTCSKAFKSGADAYFIAPGTFEDWEHSICRALEGWKTISLEVQKSLITLLVRQNIPDDNGVKLTVAEREVMFGLIHGKRDKEISNERRTTNGTTHTIVARIFRKLHVHSRGDAVNCYLGLGATFDSIRKPIGKNLIC